MRGETTRVEIRGETTRKETTRGETTRGKRLGGKRLGGETSCDRYIHLSAHILACLFIVISEICPKFKKSIK